MHGLVDDAWAAPSNFLGLPAELSDPEGARFVVVPVPYDGAASYGVGARFGPQAILDASREIELFDDELSHQPCSVGIHTRPSVEPHSGGPEAMAERVEAEMSSLFAAGQFPVLLGGDHSITIGAVRAAVERYPELTLVQIDAHADLRDHYQSTPYSHACIARRAADMGAKLVQIGIRSLSQEEADWLGRHPEAITVYARDLWENLDQADQAIDAIDGPVYLTFDVDALDPSIMPATGTPEPGGLTWPQTLALLRRLCRQGEVIGADIVELAPIPGISAPNVLTAKLAYKLIGYVMTTKRS